MGSHLPTPHFGSVHVELYGGEILLAGTGTAPRPSCAPRQDDRTVVLRRRSRHGVVLVGAILRMRNERGRDQTKRATRYDIQFVSSNQLLLVVDIRMRRSPDSSYRMEIYICCCRCSCRCCCRFCCFYVEYVNVPSALSGRSSTTCLLSDMYGNLSLPEIGVVVVVWSPGMILDSDTDRHTTYRNTVFKFKQEFISDLCGLQAVGPRGVKSAVYRIGKFSVFLLSHNSAHRGKSQIAFMFSTKHLSLLLCIRFNTLPIYVGET